MPTMIFLADFYAITGNYDQNPTYLDGICSGEEGLFIDREYQAIRTRACTTSDELNATIANFPATYAGGDFLLKFPCTLNELLALLDTMDFWDAVDECALATYKNSGNEIAAAENQQPLLQKRNNALSAVIALAKKSALNADDVSSVYAALVALAKSNDRPAPLLGYADSEGIKYTDHKDDVKFLTKDMLGDRLRRAKQR